MNEDKQLLEAAARAAGYANFEHGELTPGEPMLYVWDDDVSFWAPLQDDGDALRLAVKLRIDIRQFLQYRGAVDCLVDRLGKCCAEQIGNDPYAATRRAIVRAAALCAPTPAASVPASAPSVPSDEARRAADIIAAASCGDGNETMRRYTDGDDWNTKR